MTYYIAPYPYRMARRWARMAGYEESAHDFSLAVDVREEDNAYVISALVPGLKAEDLNIQILEDAVTVEGEFKADETEYLVRELPHTEMTRLTQIDYDREMAFIATAERAGGGHGRQHGPGPLRGLGVRGCRGHLWARLLT